MSDIQSIFNHERDEKEQEIKKEVSRRARTRISIMKAIEELEKSRRKPCSEQKAKESLGKRYRLRERTCR